MSSLPSKSKVVDDSKLSAPKTPKSAKPLGKKKSVASKILLDAPSSAPLVNSDERGRSKRRGGKKSPGKLKSKLRKAFDSPSSPLSSPPLSPRTSGSKSPGKLKNKKEKVSSSSPPSSPSSSRKRSKSRGKSPGRLKAKNDKGGDNISPTISPKSRSRSKSRGRYSPSFVDTKSKGKGSKDSKNGTKKNGKKQQPAWWNIDSAPFADEDGPGERLLTKVHEPKITEEKPKEAMANVRAKPLSPDFIKKFEPKTFTKDVESKKVLKSAAKENFILKDFVNRGKKPDIKKLINAFEPVNVNKGETIVEQGAQGDHFFVIESGDVEVIEETEEPIIEGDENLNDLESSHDDATTASRTVMKRTLIKAGSTFGDKNLLFTSPWKCSVRAAATSRDPVRIMRLSTTQYRGIMATTEDAVEKRKIAEKATEESKKKAAAASAAKADLQQQKQADDWVASSQDMALINSIKQALEKLAQDDLDRIKVLGEGQFGEVWLVGAKLQGIPPPKGKRQHEFALKVQNLSEDEEDRKDEQDMIRGEASVMKELSHPFMTTLYKTYYNEPESIDMLLGLIPGGELWDVIHVEDEATGEWQSGLPETHAQFYAAVVGDTLSWMHSKGYVYRDLKPENVMIDAQGYPLIIDMGFTKKIELQTFTFCGTPNYVSPEIIKNAGHDGGADWWAFGIVVYEAISGENPFYSDEMEEDQMALFAAICDDKPEPLQEGFSRSVVDLIDRLLVKDKSKRLGSGRGKGKDVLNHPFFNGLSLKRLRRKQIRAPWIPGEEKDTSSKRFEESVLKELEQKKKEDARSTAEAKQLELQRQREEEIKRLEEEEERRRIQEQDRRWAEEEIKRQVLETQQREKEEEDRRQREAEEQEKRRRKMDEKRLEIERLQLEEAENERRLAEKRLAVELYRQHQQEHEQEAAQIAEEERKRIEAVEQKRIAAAEAAAERLAEEERDMALLEEEKRREAAQAEAERFAEEERLRIEAEEEKERLAAIEAARLAKEERLLVEAEVEEQRRAAAEAEAARLAEEERLRQKAEEEERRQAEIEAHRVAEEERLRVEAEEVERLAAVEAERLAEEERLQAEAEEAARLAEEERLRQEAEEAERLTAMEAKRIAEEERLRVEAEEAARLAEEEEIRKEAEETARLLAEQKRKAKEARARREEKRLQKQKRQNEEAERQRIRQEKKEKLRLEVERQQREEEARKEQIRREEEELAQENSTNYDTITETAPKVNYDTISDAAVSNYDTASDDDDDDDNSISDLAELGVVGTVDAVNEARAQREARMRQNNGNPNGSRTPGRLEHSWNGVFESPRTRGKRLSDVGTIEGGLVAKRLGGHGKNVSPGGSRYSPKIQEELNKSIGKGLVAERLAKAKQKQKDGGVPSMFSFHL
mmetsp:Transcript_42656/g.102867  ORF Transcript_42656/g.102867 Transcript_42656/m.102867 type:complete len:1388 (-) Transcript_42656:2011-6174(-)